METEGRAFGRGESEGKEGSEGTSGRTGRYRPRASRDAYPYRMLDALLDDAASLKGYAVNPNHVKVADTYVRPYTVVRSCLDYEV